MITGGALNKTANTYSTVSGGCSNFTGTGTFSVNAYCTETSHAGYFASISGGGGGEASGPHRGAAGLGRESHPNLCVGWSAQSMRRVLMPRISYFYGITIWMYRPDHPPAHFHAQYGEHWAQISIADQQVLNGSLPPRALRLVTDWAKLHTAELQADWDLAQALAPLVPIDPLP
jgi:Domain of unknown function (DUF4160)